MTVNLMAKMTEVAHHGDFSYFSILDCPHTSTELEYVLIELKVEDKAFFDPLQRLLTILDLQTTTDRIIRIPYTESHA